MTNTLETMTPDLEWEGPDDQKAVSVLRERADDVSIIVWGGDWCGDCEAVLPSFAAGLEAAGIDPAGVTQYAVEKLADGSKTGPKVEAYDITLIPTIVVERNGVELVRYEEAAPVDPLTFIARGITEELPDTSRQ